EAAIQLAESASEVARKIGAANTLVRLKSGGWLAENTDAPGFTESLAQANIEIADQNVCLLGAGGAARAVALALSDMRATLTICNRTESRAEELVKHLNINADIRSLEHAEAEMGKADVVINTLSLGHTGRTLDFPEGKLRTFYDISYGKPAKAMLEQAETAGWKPLDGLSMLVAQAAFSFELWFGILPDMESALARCRKLVEATT
ncbi:MAG: shikimate dehydrogenase, partial [Hyphomonas sp.]